MIVRLLILLSIGCVASVAIAEDTYRWEDEQGRVYYSDQPPPAGARNVRRTRKYSDEEEQALPYRLQVIVDKSPVTLYVTDCGEPCDGGRELLIARGVPHTLFDPSDARVQEQLMALTGGELEVPVVEIGETVLRGFQASEWNSALDAAGYPSYAMIEVRPYVPKAAERPATRNGDNDEVAAGDAADAESGEFESDESLVEGVDTDDGDNEDADQADIELDE